jgi:hypothetical protein
MTNNKITIAIVIAGLSLVIANYAIVESYGQTVAAEMQGMSETERLLILESVLRGFGYEQVSEQDNQIEYRADGSIPIYDNAVGQTVSDFGFTLVQFTPATDGNDSVIIISTVPGVTA